MASPDIRDLALKACRAWRELRRHRFATPTVMGHERGYTRIWNMWAAEVKRLEKKANVAFESWRAAEDKELSHE